MDFALSLPGISGTIVPPPNVPTGGLSTLAQIIQVLVAVFLIIIVLLAIGYILWGAIRYTTSRGDREKVQGAREKIIYAIIGIVVAFFSFLIINTTGYFFNVNLIGQIALGPTPTPPPYSQGSYKYSQGSYYSQASYKYSQASYKYSQASYLPTPPPTLPPPTPTPTSTPTPTPTPFCDDNIDSDGLGHTETCRDNNGIFRDFCSGGVPHIYSCVSGQCQASARTACFLTDQICVVQPDGFPLCVDSKSTINGKVWLDADEDGRIDSGEPGIQGATVDAFFGSTTDKAATSLTDSTGNFEHRGLDDDTYRVKLTVPLGMRLSGGSNLGSNCGSNCREVIVPPSINIYNAYGAFGVVFQ